MDDAGSSETRRRLYLLAFVDEFAPLYALFTLWFADNGVSTSSISLVFVIWAALGVILEVPSGALADRIDRRRMIAAAFALRAIGLAVWLIWPSLTGLVIGAVLWAVHDAAASGTWEALIHDQLDARDQASTYGVVIARVGQCTNLGLAAGTVAASVLIWAGLTIDAIGWINVAIHGVAIALVLMLADTRWVARQDSDQADVSDDAATGVAAWWGTLRSGVSAVRRQRDLFRLALIGSLVGGLFVVDEYVPLLARARGVSDTLVPLLVLTVWLGLLVGGEVAARRPALRSSTLASALLAGTAAMAMAIALDSPWALLGVAAGYGVAETVWVISDARFQAAAPRATRATVTSVRSLGEGVVAGATFLLIAGLADGDDPAPGLHWAVGLLALVSFLVWQWVPEATTKRESSPGCPT